MLPAKKNCPEALDLGESAAQPGNFIAYDVPRDSNSTNLIYARQPFSGSISGSKDDPRESQMALALQDARQYHSESRFGFFSLLYWDEVKRKKQQASFRLDLMEEGLAAAPKDTDCWISQSEFSKPNRRVVNFLRTATCFVDLDTYKAPKLEGLTPEQQASVVRLHCDDEGFPTPSSIVFSGRGLQAKWYFDSPIPNKALPRWNAVQRRLVEFFADFGADPMAKDASRVLRVVGSTNSKSGSVVVPLWVDDTRYDFDTFAYETLPYLRPGHKQHNAGLSDAPLAENLNTWRVTEGLHRFSAARLWWDRMGDLRQLAQLRGWHTGGIPEGCRAAFLFVSAVALSWNARQVSLDTEVRELADQYCPTMPRDEVRDAVAGVLSRLEMLSKGHRITFGEEKIDPRYRMSNQTIREMFGISTAEEAKLRTLISKETKRARDRERKRQSRREAGVVERQIYLDTVKAGKAARRDQARELAAEGLSLKEIAQRMQVTERAVRKYLSD